ncbi:MAG: hypothetical protein CO187_10075 [Zetaproteobacteria bacterium CG_4_9_14_3_um_filter_53_7]|nr:MAG: hypothetical protein CO187_10075 [Zetaproteobacteria bacterium CG_4_9_14_3_um_filter_53_7]
MSQKTNIIKQIDQLITQEKSALLGNLREGDRLEDKLAHFMVNLQQQIDLLIETKKAEQLAAASELSDEEAAALFAETDEAGSEAEKAMQLLEKEFNTYNIKQANGIMTHQKHSTSYVVKQSLIAAAVAAGLLWFFFPQFQQDTIDLVTESPAAMQTDVADAPVIIEPVIMAQSEMTPDEKGSPTELLASAVEESDEVTEPVIPAIAESTPVANVEETSLKQVEKATEPVVLDKAPAAVSKVESLLDDTPEIKPTAKVVESKTVIGQKLKVTAHVGNARNVPKNDGKRVARVKMGDVVTKLNEQMGWYQVKLANGTVAWVYKTVFAPRLQVSVGIGNVRSEPNGKSKIVSRIKQGDFVTKLEEKGDWYLVKLDSGTQAWGHHSIF